ncbi:hypothetical protein C1646_730088 [Rhizophagus diaphanus]|nr:hypothetical protein C1646_730088 [Rhizophagus diaphanus] [Rhizophagus sp. MUCL 43196]
MSQFGIDFGCLLTVLQRNRQMGSNPVIVGSRPPPNDSLWKKIEDQGYEVKIYDREMFKDCDNKIHTKEKRVDTEIAVSMVIDTLIKIKNPGILILVAGDGDFEPALKPIMEAGWIVEVRFWTNSTSRHLKELKVGEKAVNFMPLDLEYKSFAFGSGPEPTNRKKSLEIFHKNTWENKDLIECYSGLQSSFCWWYMVDDENLVMYFKTNADLELAKRWLEKNFKDIQVWQKISLFVDAFRDCTNAIYCPNCTYCISEISESISITLMSVNSQHLM